MRWVLLLALTGCGRTPTEPHVVCVRTKPEAVPIYNAQHDSVGVWYVIPTHCHED